MILISVLVLVVTLWQAGCSHLVWIFVCDNFGDRQRRRSGIGHFDVVEQSGNEVPRSLSVSSGYVLAYHVLPYHTVP